MCNISILSLVPLVPALALKHLELQLLCGSCHINRVVTDVIVMQESLSLWLHAFPDALHKLWLLAH